ncbi:36072_t:CDS:2 [Gigaspora margarita]|uniref:36072_t:CDS:1 n=1 Tax=Gigaspora margarita TaxID=4874 RepID=A0ABN7VJC2_GIGMA|nr:36072_t:CDS:2 [Gigaspora margarita]
MIWYLCSDVTHLSAEDIQDIIKAKDLIKQALEAIANKYKILTGRYPKDIKLSSEETGSIQQADSIECNIISENKVKKTKENKPKSIHISDAKDLCKNNNKIPGTKKDIISSTKSSEDVLELFKRTNNNIEKIRASGHILISK